MVDVEYTRRQAQRHWEAVQLANLMNCWIPGEDRITAEDILRPKGKGRRKPTKLTERQCEELIAQVDAMQENARRLKEG